MGWADCGLDSKGRPIGYAFEATCDHPGCTKEIDRGLAYACGGMHGEDDPEGSCEGYFCGKHLFFAKNEKAGVRGFFCEPCAEKMGVNEPHGDE